MDRDLGKKFCRLLADAGLNLVPYHERYPLDQRVSDPDWLHDACAAGEISLSHDKNMRFTDATMERFFERRYAPSAALFVLRGNQTGDEHAAMLLAARGELERMARKYRKRDTAFVAHVVRVRAKGARETVRVLKKLDREGWNAAKARRRT